MSVLDLWCKAARTCFDRDPTEEALGSRERQTQIRNLSPHALAAMTTPIATWYRVTPSPQRPPDFLAALFLGAGRSTKDWPIEEST